MFNGFGLACRVLVRENESLHWRRFRRDEAIGFVVNVVLPGPGHKFVYFLEGQPFGFWQL
jgi:hypothetical protein